MKCIICKKQIIDNSINIYGIKICKCCEGRITHSNMQTDFYEVYKNRIKKSIVSTLYRGVKFSDE